MKKCSALLLMLVILAGCSPSQKPSVRDLYSMPSSQIQGSIAVNARSVEELENLTTNIVEGYLEDDAQEFLVKDDMGSIAYGYHVSHFNVTKVHKGELQEGDTIKLAEEYYVQPSSLTGVDTLYYCGNYMPSTSGKKYLFFLKKGMQTTEEYKDLYVPYVFEKSRYPMPDTTSRAVKTIDAMTNTELNLGIGGSEEYKELYKEVIEAYLK